MASIEERRMNERLSELPKLSVSNLLRNDDEVEEEEVVADGVEGLAGRCEGLALAGEIEGGGFKIPGLVAGLENQFEVLSLARGIEGGGFKFPAVDGGKGGRADVGSMDASAAGSVDASVRGMLRRRDRAVLACYVYRESIMGDEVVAREVGFVLLGRAPVSAGNNGGDGGGWPSACLGVYGGLGGMDGVGRGSWGKAGGETHGACLGYDGVGVWNWGGGMIWMKLKEWGCIWDVGWNGWRRVGPKVMVGGEGGGSGGPSSSGENKGANPFLPAEV